MVPDTREGALLVARMLEAVVGVALAEGKAIN